MMVAMISTGLVIRYLLPPGSGGRSGGQGLTLWNLGRHDWGDLHFWLALGLIVLLLLHVTLHWGWVYATTQRLVMPVRTNGSAGTLRHWASGAVAFAVIAALIGGFMGRASRDVRISDVHSSADIGGPRMSDASAEGATAPARQSEGSESHDDSGIRGSMTLREAAATMQISVDQLRAALRLPDTVGADERLGRLRRVYDFEMSDVRSAPQPLSHE
jgi:hypothetical protein